MSPWLKINRVLFSMAKRISEPIKNASLQKTFVYRLIKSIFLVLNDVVSSKYEKVSSSRTQANFLMLLA